MDNTHTTNDNDALFQFKTYAEFRTERLKLNYESALKLWYSLPSDLASINNKQFRRQTLRQQRTRFRIWNEMFNIPPMEHKSLYDMYQSLGQITLQFINKGETYDSTITCGELFKGGHVVWFMIAFQAQLNLPLGLTDSIFGYNMLYPYTDDLVDCNHIPREAKKEFTKIFHERLLFGESKYNPNAHFDGKQSNIADLGLSPL